MVSDELAEAAMAVILPAGEARTMTRQALDLVVARNFSGARQHLADAEERLTESHRGQTRYVQAEARGETQEYSILFTHAQDTLMTIMAEHSLATKLVDLFEAFDQRIAAVEERTAGSPDPV